MFVGHAAAALAAKGVRPAVPLAALLLASFGVDLLEALLWTVGQRESVPQPAESVPVTLALSAGIAAAVGAWTRSGPAALATGLVALSHLPLDLVSGRVALWPGAPSVGLLLFERPLVDGALEIALAAAGWAVWRQSLPPDSRRRPLAVAVLLGLALAQVGFLVVLEGGT